MKLLIVGATGSIGRHLVTQAVDAGHSVTALTRIPAESGFASSELLTTLAGSATDADSLAEAIPGHDAVLVSLGGGLTGNVRSAGTKNIIDAMITAGVKRLICQTTLGLGESRQLLNFKWKFLFGGLLRFAYNDHAKQEEYVRNSGLHWTLVRPAAFTDGPTTGDYRHSFGNNVGDLRLDISRADVAHFMLEQAETDANVGEACGLSY